MQHDHTIGWILTEAFHLCEGNTLQILMQPIFSVPGSNTKCKLWQHLHCLGNTCIPMYSAGKHFI